jgi:hypothetical protein
MLLSSFLRCGENLTTLRTLHYLGAQSANLSRRD